MGFTKLLAGSGLCVLCSARLAVAAASFQVIPGAPGGTDLSTPSAISGDGKVVVGQTVITTNTLSTAFRWTQQTGTVSLGTLPTGTSASGSDVSYDGSIICGSGTVKRPSGSTKSQAFLWTSGSGMVNISPPDPGDTGTNYNAIGISSDGSVVVGLEGQPFRWTALGGFTYLTIDSSAAYAVTDDGLTVAGSALTGPTGGGGAATWTSASGWIGIPQASGGGSGYAHDLSPDGNFVVGRYKTFSQSNYLAFRWSSTAGTTFLGDLPGGDVASMATAVSADGSIVVGRSGTSSPTFLDTPTGTEAFVWDAANGMRKLSTVLTNDGVDLSGWVLRSADDISDDGTTIVGWGELVGHRQGFIAVIPEPATTTLLLGAPLVLLRRRHSSKKRCG